jgi:hypothetical protein
MHWTCWSAPPASTPRTCCRTCGDRPRRPHAGRGLGRRPRGLPRRHGGGFPNLFLMLGPNTGTGHTSRCCTSSPRCRLRLRAMQPGCASSEAAAIEVRAEMLPRTTTPCSAAGRLGVEHTAAAGTAPTRQDRRAVAGLHAGVHDGAAADRLVGVRPSARRRARRCGPGGGDADGRLSADRGGSAPGAAQSRRPLRRRSLPLPQFVAPLRRFIAIPWPQAPRLPTVHSIDSTDTLPVQRITRLRRSPP